MGKYLKKFKLHYDYEQFKMRGGVQYITHNVSACVNEEEIHYNPVPPPPYLTFIAEQANSTIQLNRFGTATTLKDAVLQYSTDNGKTWSGYTLGYTITLANVGDSVKFKGKNTTLGYDFGNYHQFFMTGKIGAKGDVTSLFNGIGGNFQMQDFGCCYLFYKCTSLITAPELPSTTLRMSCYSSMFGQCVSLTTAPELPAKTLAQSCYSKMFGQCESLETAPELPATDLVRSCYDYMFQGCKKLNYIKAMFTTTPSTRYTTNWVEGVKSEGTFVKNAEAEWYVTGVNGIPEGWTVEKATP